MQKLEFEKELRFPDASYHCVAKVPDNQRVRIDSQGFDFLKIAYQKNALYNTGYRGKVILNVPYIPSARQDRICNAGEPFSAKVIGQAINYLGFDQVLTVVPHSDVIGAVIDNLLILELEDIFSELMCPEFHTRRITKVVLVAPDAGASKRTLAVAKDFGFGMIQANKVRDVTTGQIKSIEVPQELNPDLNYIVVDDVCAKGGTFFGLHEALTKKGAKKIDLAVAHVDLDNGIEKLAGIYNKIFTTNSQADYGTIFDHLKNVTVVDVFA
jgi:ribose-phosphate pyrophosphokinase